MTRGEKGSIAYDGSEFITYGIVPCNVVDTMGAGDGLLPDFCMESCREKQSEKQCTRALPIAA
ncbi:MAG: hypothetical protein V8R80_00830 [Eubacterium sp.]